MKNSQDNILHSLLQHDPSDLGYKKVEFRMRVAANIDDQMKAKHISKIGLARKMQIQPSVVTRWLSGGHNFTIDTLVEIAHALDITVHNLIARKEPHYQVCSGNVFTIAC